MNKKKVNFEHTNRSPKSFWNKLKTNAWSHAILSKNKLVLSNIAKYLEFY